MNKTEFLNRVKEGLDSISKEEQENALRYYVEYFQDAGEENEEEVIKELGTPEEVVAKIKSEMNLLDEDNSNKKMKPWLIVLIVLASPFILTGLAIVASLMLVILSLLFALAITSFALLTSGIICAVISLLAISVSGASFVFLLGLGLMMISGGLFCSLLTYYSTKLVIDLTKKIYLKIAKGVK